MFGAPCVVLSHLIKQLLDLARLLSGPVDIGVREHLTDQDQNWSAWILGRPHQ